MEIIKIPAARIFFNLNISSRELKIIQKLNNVCISNLVWRRLHKTMRTSTNENKKIQINHLLNKISYPDGNFTAKNGYNKKNEIIKQQSVNFSARNKPAKARHQQGAPRKPGGIFVNTNQKAIDIKKLNMLGVNITLLPKSYGELLSVVKRNLPPDVSATLEKRFKSLSDEQPLSPKLTQKILRELSYSPACIAKFAGHFGGKQIISWSQNQTILPGVQIGKKGLCGCLALKWCGDKFQNVDFFNDIASPEGLDEIVSLKLSKNSNQVASYCLDRGLRPDPGLQDGIDIQRNSFNLITLAPENGQGHSLAAQCYKEAKEYRFFDANTGEFSFSSPESMEHFIENYVSLLYPTLVHTKTLHFNPLIKR